MIGLTFDFVFMWFNCPAAIWSEINALTLRTGLCNFSSTYVELVLATAFVLVVLFLELLMFLPFYMLETFMVRVEYGYSKANFWSALINRFLPMQMVLLMYVPVILFTTRVVEW
jgi:hypothetical protein